MKKGLVVLDDDGTVLEVRQMEHEEESTEFYDGLLVPGFVNSHCHIELSHLKGRFCKGSGMAGFIRQINSLRESSPKEERIHALSQQMDQLYESGVSAMADISNCEESFIAKANSKMYTRTFLEVFGTEPDSASSIVEGVVELNAKATIAGIDAAPTPHSCYTMSPKLLEEVSAHALSAGWLSYHNQESWEEEELLISGQGPLAEEYRSRSLSTPPITGKPSLFYFLERLKNAGQVGDQRILLVHNTSATRESVKEAINLVKNLYWAICPLSNLFIHKSLPPLAMMMEEGAVITLGTDSLSSNDLLSMAAEIKCLHDYFPSTPLEQIIEWATINGARFLGKESYLGSIEPGKKPGIVLISDIDWKKMQLTTKSKTVRLV